MWGVLPVNKPAGMTSRDVCNRIEKLVRPIKVGHTGTLDPMATGVLLVAVGAATRLVEFSHGHSKDYEADFLLGVRSSTLDTTAELEYLTAPDQPTQAALLAEIERWIGCVQQAPPKFSAVHVAGRRAYDLARRGTDFELPTRAVEIHDLNLTEYAYPHFTLQITCGSGTYIRSLGHDIAQGLGTAGVMCRLVRTRVGPFKLDDCVTLDALSTREQVGNRLMPPQLLIADMETLVIDTHQCQRIRHGQPLQLSNQQCARWIAVDEQQTLVAILERTAAADSYRSLRVFQAETATPQPSKISSPHKPES